MRSTFQGLETAKRGMFTQQGALHTTGHNIANANTPGFSRQRVNFQQTQAFPTAAMNRPQIPGQMGTGVEAGSIQRVREQFVDTQYRSENNKLGYWNTRSQTISKVEDIMNEPSDNGLAATMSQFWQSLQDLSASPENEGARSVVLERGNAVADTFKYLSESVSSIKKDLGNEVSVSIKEINSILEQIADMNKQIKSVEPHGYLPNDLYDQRDQLVDQLSQFVNVKVDRVASGGNSLDIAEGTYTIKLIDANGATLKDAKGSEVTLVNGMDFQALGIKGGQDSDGDKIADKPSGDIVSALTIYRNGNPVDIDFYNTDTGKTTFSQGKLSGLIESYGYQAGNDADGNPVAKGIYPEMLDSLDKLAFTFGSIFNEVHKSGYQLDSTEKGTDFFGGLDTLNTDNYKGAANLIKMNDLTTKEIAASSESEEAGNGLNAINLSNLQNFEVSKVSQELEGNLGNINTANLSAIETGSIKSFYEGVIGRMGVDAQQAVRLSGNSQVLRDSVDERRQSVSAVSLDEEMTNMVKFQHAYNAAARHITVVDEMLDKIINGMGVVGR